MSARTPAVARVGFDLAAPLVLFYLLRGAGVSNQLALVAGASIPAAGAAYALASGRGRDNVALFMLATMLAALVMSLLAGSPRFLLAKDGVITALWGAWFVWSVRARRPAAFTFARPLLEGRKVFAAGSWDSLWESEPGFRRIWRVASVLWGVGLLLDAGVRVAISYTLPIDVVPGLGGLLYPVTFAVLQVVSNVYYHRAGLYRILGARWLEPRVSRGPQAHS